MKSTLLLLLLLMTIGCSQSSTSDPTPTPAPSDYSSCRYAVNYKLRYSPLNPAKPVTLTYLDSTQKAKTVMLKDTALDLNLTYKYGDSVYAKLSPSFIYFLNKSGNKISFSYSSSNKNSSSCPVQTYQGGSNGLSVRADSVPSAAFSMIPYRFSK